MKIFDKNPSFRLKVRLIVNKTKNKKLLGHKFTVMGISNPNKINLMS